MGCALLTWKEENKDSNGDPAWKDYRAAAAGTREGNPYRGTWCVGRNVHIRKRDLVFVMKQGRSPNGIVAAGIAVSDCYEAPDFRDPTKRVSAVDVEFTKILNDNYFLPMSVGSIGVSHPKLAGVNWNAQQSGNEIDADAAHKLLELWTAYVDAQWKPKA